MYFNLASFKYIIWFVQSVFIMLTVLIPLIYWLWRMYVGVYMIISIPVGDTNLYPLMNVQSFKLAICHQRMKVSF